MSDTWSTGGTWLKLRAARAHDALGRRARRRGISRATTRAPATTCSRSRTTGGSRTRTRSTGSSSSRASSSTASSPAPATATSSATASRRPRTTCTRSRRSTPTSQLTAEWIVRARRRRLPRASVLDRRDPGTSSCRRTSSGSRSTTPGASSRSVAASRPCTGTSCSRRGGCARRSRPTTRTTRATTRTSRGRGCSVGERSRAGVLEALAAGSFYGLDRPAHPRGPSSTATSVEVRCSPCRSVTLVSGRSTALGGHGRVGSATGTRDASSSATATGCVVHARLDMPAAARHVRVEVTDASGKESVGEPVPRLSRASALEELAGRAVRPARHRRRDHRRRRSPPTRRAPGSPSRSWTPGDFGGSDVERVVEAHPRRPSLPPPRRRAASCARRITSAAS